MSTAAQIARNFERAGKLARDVVRRAMPALRAIAVSENRKNFNSGLSPDGTAFAPLKYPRPDGSSQPLRDKGLLGASLSATSTEDEVVLKASHAGANLHQYGGTVRARKKFLTIPKTVEAKRVGSPGGGRFPRPLFFVAATNPRHGLLCESDASGRLVVHYVLVPEVTVPAREFVGFTPAALDKMRRVLADTWAETFAKTFGGS